MNLIYRLRLKLYLMFHPILWKHGIQLNGLPKIDYQNRLTIGNNISINSDCYLNCVGGVIIDDNVTLSRGVTILTSGLLTDNYKYVASQRVREHVSSPVKIGQGCWICANVIVTKGVEIAPFCIIGAGSVVTQDLDKPYSLYGGIPARFIKRLD